MTAVILDPRDGLGYIKNRAKVYPGPLHRRRVPKNVWNARTDLVNSLAAGASNPNGRWSYGRKDALAVFSLITNVNTNGWFGNQSFNTPFFYVGTGRIDAHVPIGVAGQSTLRWTAPADMVVSLDFRVGKSSTGGNGVIHSIRVNGSIVNTSPVIQGPAGVHNYVNESISIGSGQHIDFDCDRNSDDGFDNFFYERVIITQVSS